MTVMLQRGANDGTSGQCWRPLKGARQDLLRVLGLDSQGTWLAAASCAHTG